jgi:threonine dehydrogenase-like Zn-dependent dehydrogenase
LEKHFFKVVLFHYKLTDIDNLKAAKWHSARDIRLEETEIPTTGKSQVKIDVQFAGIYGSDFHEYIHGPVAVHAVLKSGLNMGQTYLIYGAGSIGFLCVQAAITAGATEVIIRDIAEKRLEKAKSIGSTTIIDGKSVDIPKQIKKLTNVGVAVFLDATRV